MRVDTLRFVSGIPVKNNGGSLTITGTFESGVAGAGIGMDKLGAPVVNPYAVEVAAQGNKKPISGGTFNTLTDTPINFLTSGLGGSGSNALKHGVLQSKGDNKFVSYERYHITAISVSGLVTKGGSAGSAVTLSADDAAVGNGEFQYTINGKTIVNGDY